MGYNTKFEGKLTFKIEPTLTQLSALQDILGEDCRDHPDWNAPKYCYYIDLRLVKGFGGIEWDSDTEKCSDMANIINTVLAQMRKSWPNFGLEGSLLAQGDELDDRYMVVIGDDGLAHKEKIVPSGTKVACPDCGHQFRVKIA